LDSADAREERTTNPESCSAAAGCCTSAAESASGAAPGSGHWCWPESCKDSGHRNGGSHERRNDPPEDADWPATINRGSIVELAWQTPDELRERLEPKLQSGERLGSERTRKQVANDRQAGDDRRVEKEHRERTTESGPTLGEMTIGALAGIQERGLSVPQDMALLGFDDFAGGVFRPRLSTVAQPTCELGATAARCCSRSWRTPPPRCHAARLCSDTWSSASRAAQPCCANRSPAPGECLARMSARHCRILNLG
jgi:hypothetical protein